MFLLNRLYIWSIVFEPLLFFVLFQRAFLGIPGNVSRILQMLVLLSLTLRLLTKLTKVEFSELRIANFASPLYINFTIYFSLLLVAGYLGVITGAYDLPSSYLQSESLSSFSTLLNSAEFRPFFEYLIAAYYIIYFAILPKFILKTETDVIYFFTVFKVMFIISFVVGVIDYGFAAIHIDLVPRHIADGIHVGLRFHGLGGEPRQAFLYLFLGLAVLHLQAYFIGKKLSKWWVLVITIAALLTESVSGLLGILAFISLYAVYSLSKLKSFFKMFSIGILIIFLLYAVVLNSERIHMALESASNVWTVLETGGELPYLMKVQSDSIYPLYDLTVKFRNNDFLPIFIGSGLGSASVVNNVYADVIFGTSNPNSQFVRILYESGLIGMLFFILAFTWPVKYLTRNLNPATRHNFIAYMLLLVGCSFGVRTSIAYIYLGIFLASFSVLGQNIAYRDAMGNSKDNSKIKIRDV